MQGIEILISSAVGVDGDTLLRTQERNLGGESLRKGSQKAKNRYCEPSRRHLSGLGGKGDPL